MLGHGGGSFVVGYPLRTTRRVKEPPLSIPQFNSLWDIPGSAEVIGNGVAAPGQNVETDLEPWEQ